MKQQVMHISIHNLTERDGLVFVFDANGAKKIDKDVMDIPDIINLLEGYEVTCSFSVTWFCRVDGRNHYNTMFHRSSDMNRMMQVPAEEMIDGISWHSEWTDSDFCMTEHSANKVDTESFGYKMACIFDRMVAGGIK